MSKVLENYVLYEIRCKDPNITDKYVGSTSNFKRRLYDHRTRCKNPSNPSYSYKVYDFIRKNGGFDNWEMVIVKELKEKNWIEIRQQERYYAQQVNATLNDWKAYSTQTERQEHYKKGSEWYEKNKERSRNRYQQKCLMLYDLEKENQILKDKLNKIMEIIGFDIVEDDVNIEKEMNKIVSGLDDKVEEEKEEIVMKIGDELTEN